MCDLRLTDLNNFQLTCVTVWSLTLALSSILYDTDSLSDSVQRRIELCTNKTRITRELSLVPSPHDNETMVIRPSRSVCYSVVR